MLVDKLCAATISSVSMLFSCFLVNTASRFNITVKFFAWIVGVHGSYLEYSIIVTAAESAGSQIEKDKIRHLI